MFMLMIFTLTSMLIIWMKHPLSLGLMLLIQTINLSLYIGYYSTTYWFSYILFLIMIGSMLILFIYMTSVASNEKFYFSINMTMLSLMLLSIWMIMYNFMNPSFIKLNYKIENITTNKFEILLTKYINFPNHYMYYMLIIYLLITLLVIVQITNFKKSGTLRSSTNYENTYTKNIPNT
uniref:NADH-ubiquinone oxidoreductase chain 6 n=1 Tax=Tiniocellus sarawacus TaxID=206932 RepID=A0A1X9HEX6_9SCAR|nr:NADH deshydrogenase subunit 6 [Tiniocellus sarawacus]